MQLAYSQEQQMLADSAARFVQDHYDFNHRAKRLEQGTSFESKHWSLFAELGWTALLVTEQNGGLGGGLGDLLALQQEMGAGLVQEPFISSIVLSTSLLDWCGSEQQIEQWLSPIISTDKRLALAVTENGQRYNVMQPNTHAKQVEQGYQLSGQKINVIDGGGADGYIVSANIESQGCALFIVEADTPGLGVTKALSSDDRQNCNLILNDVVVPATAMLCADDEGEKLLSRAYDLAAAVICADMTGSIRALLNVTVDYAKQREQFGQPIGKFQVLQHRMADMFIALQRARSMLVMLVMAYDDNERDDTAFSKAVSAAKVQINESARFVGQQAVQIHGGIGITEELNVGHYFKRLIVNEAAFGDSRYHLNRYVKLGGN